MLFYWNARVVDVINNAGSQQLRLVALPRLDGGDVGSRQLDFQIHNLA
jgi:hypothetical protein